ncbi:MAG: hypothetical protein LBT51_09335 [Fusobacteriaceae bacterium]|jgi:hypothetical protein|nr:hypothetical protein [Fusobacteriaceae bacterium]
MLCIISLIFAFVEASLPLNNSLMIISLPLFSYMLNLKKVYSIVGLVILSLILSLQTSNFVRICLALSIGYFAFDFLYQNIGYNKKSIFAISIIQLVLYGFMNYKTLNIFWIIGNFIGFLIFNFFFTRRKITSAK